MEKSKKKISLKNFSVNKYAPFWSIAPLVIFLIAVFVIIGFGVKNKSVTSGFGIGIDFEGGTLINVKLGAGAHNDKDYRDNSQKIKRAIEKNGVTVSYTRQEKADNAADSSISMRYKNTSKDDKEIERVNKQVIKSINEIYNFDDPEKFITYQSIGASAASDLLSKAGISVLVSTILILIYIMIRFTPIAAVAAIIALLHDVVMMFALTVIFRIQINQAFIAGIITIIAYSINDTIVIFDRCREEVKKHKGDKKVNYVAVGDKSVRNTATRSIYTTITTMIAIVLLAIIGGDAIREFSIPIIFGLIVGLYSSVFLSVPMWTAFNNLNDYVKAKRKNKDVSRDEFKDEVVIEEEPKVQKKKEKKKVKENKNVIYKYKKKKNLPEQEPTEE